jgi:HSP20 family protein
MTIRDLIPWNRDRDTAISRGETTNPFFNLHREMNRLFDEAFRSFDLSPFRSNGGTGWPNIEVNETDKEVRVVAELPGLDEKDVQVEYADGVLAIRGEKKTETEDRDRVVSEFYYGHFERRIRVDDIDADKIGASFKNGVLTVKLPKSATARERVKRIEVKAN